MLTSLWGRPNSIAGIIIYNCHNHVIVLYFCLNCDMVVCVCFHRKRAKLQGQFKGMVRGAQKGALSGNKMQRTKKKAWRVYMALWTLNGFSVMVPFIVNRHPETFCVRVFLWAVCQSFRNAGFSYSAFTGGISVSFIIMADTFKMSLSNWKITWHRLV